jgi:hypothetical protein
MDGEALGEAVMRAMHWYAPGHKLTNGYTVTRWTNPEGTSDGPLDFTGPGKWAAFGEVLAECERRGWRVLAMGTFEIVRWSDKCILADVSYSDADDWPRALAVAYVRAVAGEGRA